MREESDLSDKGFVMSLWLFNIYMDEVTKKLHMKVMKKKFTGKEWSFELNQFLFADDATLVANQQKIIC